MPKKPGQEPVVFESLHELFAFDGWPLGYKPYCVDFQKSGDRRLKKGRLFVLCGNQQTAVASAFKYLGAVGFEINSELPPTEEQLNAQAVLARRKRESEIDRGTGYAE